MNRLQWIFTGCAIVGGTLFLIRLALQLLGLSAEEALDSADALESTEADASFRALSLLGVTAFLMMFGLGGRAMLESRPGSAPLALGVGLLAGGIRSWIVKVVRVHSRSRCVYLPVPFHADLPGVALQALSLGRHPGDIRKDRRQTARCIHGGGTLVWPLIQDCAYISLTPMTISIPLQNALSCRTSVSTCPARSPWVSAPIRTCS
jgi:hypothetical protein